MNLLASEQGDWVCELETKATGGGARIVKATPVFPRVLDAACDLLERVAERRIYLSATLAGWEHQARWLGIDVKHPSSRFISLSSPFPVEHRQIFVHNSVTWRDNRELREFEFRHSSRRLRRPAAFSMLTPTSAG
jgi:hypothetical protein